MAEREVREGLILEAVVKAKGLCADDAEVDARNDRLAREQGRDPKKLRKAYREADLIESIRGQLLDEKALEWLSREAVIEEAAQE